MEMSINFSTYTLWSSILTLFLLGLTVLAFIFKWGIRFRLVGTTGFIGLLTVGLFGLSLGLSTHEKIPGSVRYYLVYDNSANQVVVSVKPNISPDEAEATLRQAASDLYSPGRLGLGKDRLTIRLRTVIHPEEGLSVPLYLGQVERSLSRRNDENMKIDIFEANFAKLPEELPSQSKFN